MSLETSRNETNASSKTGKSQFVEKFGGVYEHSPWVAETVWDQFGPQDLSTLERLRDAMQDVVQQADDAAKLKLIREHPDLADPAAKLGKLSDMSNREQKNAGLTSATTEEAQRFIHLNNAYKAKFGFPFVIAVKGLDRNGILAAFEQRLENDPATEFSHALEQIHRIAGFRLSEIFGTSSDRA